MNLLLLFYLYYIFYVYSVLYTLNNYYIGFANKYNSPKKFIISINKYNLHKIRK